MKTKLKIGLIGCGSMGSIHARVIANSSSADLFWVHDPNQSVAASVANKHSSTAIEEIQIGKVDAVVIATPTESHYQLAKQVISEGKPLLLEKPLTDNYQQTLELVNMAVSGGVPLMCGLLERFNPALETARKIAHDVYSLRTTRHSPYVSRIRTGVGLDLLIHDLDFGIRLLGETPISIHGIATRLHSDSKEDSEDIAECMYKNSDGAIVTHSVSRLAHTKLRHVTITERTRVIDVDLLRQDITIYRNVDTSVVPDPNIGYAQQSIIEIPVIQQTGEPLAKQLEHFLRLCNGKVDPESEAFSILPSHKALDDFYASIR
jgi:predicted dehydrogenase